MSEHNSTLALWLMGALYRGLETDEDDKNLFRAIHLVTSCETCPQDIDDITDITLAELRTVVVILKSLDCNTSDKYARLVFRITLNAIDSAVSLTKEPDDTESNKRRRID